MRTVYLLVLGEGLSPPEGFKEDEDLAVVGFPE